MEIKVTRGSEMVDLRNLFLLGNPCHVKEIENNKRIFNKSNELQTSEKSWGVEYENMFLDLETQKETIEKVINDKFFEILAKEIENPSQRALKTLDSNMKFLSKKYNLNLIEFDSELTALTFNNEKVRTFSKVKYINSGGVVISEIIKQFNGKLYIENPNIDLTDYKTLIVVQY